MCVCKLKSQHACLLKYYKKKKKEKVFVYRVNNKILLEEVNEGGKTQHCVCKIT